MSFTIFSLHASHELFYRITGPFRMYYHIRRWLFGNDYIPFETSKEEAEIHPVSQFIIDNYEYIRLSFISFPFIILKMSMILVIYLIRRTFSHETNYCHQFYLKTKRFIGKPTISLILR